MTTSDADPLDQYLARVRRRAEALTRRAQEKYGERATLPGGDPERDVYDYCLNELAGLGRYAQMMRARLQEWSSMDGNRLARGDYIFRRLEEMGEHYAALLERFRAELVNAGYPMGDPEQL